jgi:NADH:ubiquinone oxidoreductase subunit 6 (subunit J)
MTGVEILFALLGAVAVAAALLVVGSSNLVHAALWLVVALGALAGCYLLLTAEFIAWVQVLIYVGAVVVLLLFGLMLTRAPIGYSAELTSGNRWAAAAVLSRACGLKELEEEGGSARIGVDETSELIRGIGPVADIKGFVEDGAFEQADFS